VTTFVVSHCRCRHQSITLAHSLCRIAVVDTSESLSHIRCAALPLSTPVNHSRNSNPYALCFYLFPPVPHFSSLPQAELPLGDELICPAKCRTRSLSLLASKAVMHLLHQTHLSPLIRLTLLTCSLARTGSAAIEKALAVSVPHCTTKWLECGHWIQNEEKTQVNKLLVDFLRAAPTPAKL
jgi:hypothetical protein